MAYIGSPAAPTVATVSDGTVTSAKLADDAVTSAKITDGAVTPSDLSTGHPNWDSSGNFLHQTTSNTISGTSINKMTLGDGTGQYGIIQNVGTGSGYYGFANNGTYKARMQYDLANEALTFQTNATERMRIDSSGRVTMPYQPWFFADLTTSWTGWNPGNATAPQYFDRVVGSASSNFNTSTGVFTAPVTGIYGFWASCWGSVNISQLWGIYNGSRIQSFQVSEGTSVVNVAGSFVYRMNANDTMGFKAFGSGSSGTIISSTVHSFFQGYLIG